MIQPAGYRLRLWYSGMVFHVCRTSCPRMCNSLLQLVNFAWKTNIRTTKGAENKSHAASSCPQTSLRLKLRRNWMLWRGLITCQRKFSSKTSELRTNVQGQSRQDVNQVSKQEQIACGSSREEQKFGNVWIHCWNHSFFSYPGVAEVGPLFPQFHGSIWESWRQKVYRIVARARFALEHVKNRGPRAALLEDEAGKMCTRQ